MGLLVRAALTESIVYLPDLRRSYDHLHEVSQQVEEFESSAAPRTKKCKVQWFTHGI